jgi:hypothetical protein
LSNSFFTRSFFWASSQLSELGQPLLMPGGPGLGILDIGDFTQPQPTVLILFFLAELGFHLIHLLHQLQVLCDVRVPIAWVPLNIMCSG